VKEVDERPQQIGEIVLEAGAREHGAEGLEHGLTLAAQGVGVGQRSRIGLVRTGAMSVERKLVEEMRSRRGRVQFGIGVGVAVGEEVGSFGA
jgi:hypothetical protein